MDTSNEEIEGRAHEEQANRNLIDSLGTLQLFEPAMLEALERSREGQEPMTLYVRGYVHDADIVLAALRVAQAYGVTLTFVPRPPHEVIDKAPAAKHSPPSLTEKP